MHFIMAYTIEDMGGDLDMQGPSAKACIDAVVTYGNSIFAPLHEMPYAQPKFEQLETHLANAFGYMWDIQNQKGTLLDPAISKERLNSALAKASRQLVDIGAMIAKNAGEGPAHVSYRLFEIVVMRIGGIAILDEYPNYTLALRENS